MTTDGVGDLTDSERVAVAALLADPRGRRLATAGSAQERANAVNDWLNAHEIDRSRTGEATGDAIGEVRGLRSALAPGAGRVLKLPAAPVPAITLVDAIHTRRSRYAFSKRPLALARLGALLRHSVGVGRRVDAFGRADYPLGVAPSAGGLNSVVAYVVAANVEDLPPGLYRYEPEEQGLTELAVGEVRSCLTCIYGQPELADRSAVTIVLVARLADALRKYSVRHYRTLHVDTGIAAQNLYLVATALGLSCCAVSGYLDTAVSDLLDLDDGRFPTLLMAVGGIPCRTRQSPALDSVANEPAGDDDGG